MNKEENTATHYGQGLVDVYIDASIGKMNFSDSSGVGIYLRHEDGRSWMYFLGADYYVPNSEVWACVIALSLLPITTPINICTDYTPLYDFFIAGQQRQDFFHLKEGGRFFCELMKKLKKRKYTKTLVNSMTNRHHLVSHNLANMARVLVKKKYIENNTFYVPKDNRFFCLWSKEAPFFNLCEKGFFVFPENIIKNDFYPFDGHCFNDNQSEYPDKELSFIPYNKKGERLTKLKKEDGMIFNKKIQNKKEKEEDDMKKQEKKKKNKNLNKQQEKNTPIEKPFESNHSLTSCSEQDLLPIQKITKEKNENIEEDVIVIDLTNNVKKNLFNGFEYCPLTWFKNNVSIFNYWRNKNPSVFISPVLETLENKLVTPPNFLFKLPIEAPLIDFLFENQDFSVDADSIKKSFFKVVAVHCYSEKETIWKEKEMGNNLTFFLRKISFRFAVATLGRKYAHAHALLLNMPEKEDISAFVLDQLLFIQDSFKINILTSQGSLLTDFYFSPCKTNVFSDFWKKAGSI